MKVRCISIEPTPADAKKITNFYRPGKMKYGIQLGEKYNVYGISIIDGVMLVEILSSGSGHLISVPIFLFEMLDNRVSQYWEIKVNDDGSMLFWPNIFYTPYFHDQLSDYVPEIVERFEQIRLKMDMEY